MVLNVTIVQWNPNELILQIFRFDKAVKVYICSACKLIVIEPLTMSDHFGQCTIVHFEEDKGSAYIGMIDVWIGTRIYECAVCERTYCLKYFMLLHLTEKHHITLTNCPSVVLPMEFISMSALIQEMSN